MIYAIKQISTGHFKTKGKYHSFSPFGLSTKFYSSTGQVRSSVTSLVSYLQSFNNPINDYEIVSYEITEVGTIPHIAPKKK